MTGWIVTMRPLRFIQCLEALVTIRGGLLSSFVPCLQSYPWGGEGRVEWVKSLILTVSAPSVLSLQILLWFSR